MRKKDISPSESPLSPHDLILRSTIMFRSALLRSARALPRLSVSRSAPTPSVARPSSLLRPSQFAPAASVPAFRFYSAPAGLAKPEVEGRIVDLLKNFDKVGSIPWTESVKANDNPGQRPIKGTPKVRSPCEESSSNNGSFPALRTSQTTLASTAWIQWKW
jgi:hypothetical protein